MTTHDCDVLVVGAGAAGMTCAITAAHLGLNVLLVEKEDRVGGTTARSGGWLWVPGSDLARELGIQEAPGAARAYIRDQATTHWDPARVDAFLTQGPRAIEFLVRNTHLRFDVHPQFPDYHAEAPGGARGGRSMATRPFDARLLGSHVHKLAPPLPELTVFGMMLGSGKDLWHFIRAFKSWVSFSYVARRVARQVVDVLVHGRGMWLANGNALAGRLLRSALDANVPIWTGAVVTELSFDAGRVSGAIVHGPQGHITVRARRGVVLACGGFPHDAPRCSGLYPHCVAGHRHMTPSPAGNTGDGLRLGESAGGFVDHTIPNAAAWTPASRVRRRDGTEGVMPHFVDRAKPGVLAVDRSGRRFTNEANSYHDFVQAMFKANAGQEEPMAWLICDHRALRTYGLGCIGPFPMPLKHHLKTGYLKRGRTIEALATELHIDPTILRETLEVFNADAARGVDTRHGKGSTAYNQFQGDALHKPNPCLAPLVTPPFYAIRLVAADIGTFAGLTTDAQTRVLRRDGTPINGLYAIGNDAASVMGGNYPGGGITLGPAVTFGYVCAHTLHAAQPITSNDRAPAIAVASNP